MNARTTRPSSSLVSTPRLAVALTLALGGACLSKPDRPVGLDGGGNTDASGAGIDAGGCPVGQQPFPADLVLRRASSIGDLAADGVDDLVLWGRTENGAGDAFAFVGTPGTALRCVTVVPFPANVEPIDVRIVDVDLAGSLDLLMFGREQVPTPSTYQVLLYRDFNPTMVAGEPVRAIVPINAAPGPWGDNIGGSLTTPEPGYVTAWSAPVTSPPGVVSEVIFGGLYAPQAALRYDPNGNMFEPVRQLVYQPGPLDAVQDMTALAGTAGRPVAATLQGHVHRMRYDEVNDRFDNSDVQQLGEVQRRFVRWRGRAIGAGINVGITERTLTSGDRGVDVIGVSTSPGAPTVTEVLDTGLSDGTLVFDLAIGDLDSDARLDAVNLAGNLSTVEVRVYRNLTVPGGVQTIAPLVATLAARPNIVVVGDFDGVPATPETIFAISTTPAASGGDCLHIVGGALPCLVGCGTSSCP